MIRNTISIGLLAASLALGSNALAASPTDSVDAFHAALLDNMKHGGACSARAQHLKPVIDKSFDVPFLAQRILRKHWSELSADQQKDFTAAFDDMIVSTYAAQFKSYSNESFDTQGTEDISAGNKVVHVLFKHGDSTKFDYVLHADSSGTLRIVNVIADGVSDLAIRTAQYDKLYQAQGYAGLLAYIKDQTAKTKASC
ncbi:MAG TPA: ABC transporter substrate-binding protein [Nevskiaceae bacterium]|nr:ABC transporter substrate-binding protein [Nevskiaceae bacterium]